jgi:hypothetical protein
VFGFGYYNSNGGLYGRKRNQPVDLEAQNPKPEGLKTADSGNAGLDGYTVLSRADRETGQRPSTGGYPCHQGPRFSEEQ